MADTRDGALLTDRHRRRQVAFATASDSEVRRAFRLLDLGDIDGSRAVWREATLQSVAGRYAVSQSMADAYLRAYRAAELGAVAGGTVLPSFDYVAAGGVLDAVGPQALKRQIGMGLPPAVAYANVRRQVVTEAQKLILGGGRGVVRESGRRDSRAIGWRRVSDGDPCTFCAMLVSRGPAYTSEALALTKGATDDPYHPRCGCTVEVIYGDWQPTEAEQVFVDAYFDAAEAADSAGEPRTAETVLHRMRSGGTFTDSPARRSIEKAANT